MLVGDGEFSYVLADFFFLVLLSIVEEDSSSLQI